MKRPTILSKVVVVLGLGFSAPLLAAAELCPARPAPASSTQHSAGTTAETCMPKVRAFIAEMSKQHYWSGGSNSAYGYPMGAYGSDYGYGMVTAGRPIGMTGYARARPGYEIRTLLASANILAQTGKKQACESVLALARTLFIGDLADLHSRGISWAGRPGWRQREITAAKPVTRKDASFRSDRLLGAGVVNSQDETLGSVHDFVTNPQTGKLAYLVIARGGLFGIDASYTPVPWSNFKATVNGSLLVLDTTKAVFAAAPQGRDDQFTKAGQFDSESQKVEAYWTAHLKLALAN
jgi:sporulation protein YlmC with PRC-barrel domain